VCIFPTPACGQANLREADDNTFQCCEITQPFNKDVSAPLTLAYFTTLAVVIGVGLYVRRRSKSMEDTAENNRLKKCTRILSGIFINLVVAAIIIEMVIMPKKIQQSLSPADRSAQLVLDSFLEPIKEVFVFLEDAMVVKVCSSR
jgi:hypothetical protein